ncbi:rhodanese-like domain-containing protein [Demequina sediminicola]|uniref:rhodanese-like domain-containing protein n=1 Tax=Demequina sediminicola TaxID=1095026 RepID=UPI0009E19CFF|nr:rhodanese-like domain-containing protein [Demequina sediminicola]
MNTADAAAHFRSKLAFETDPSDVAAALEGGTADFVFVDTRNEHAWKQGHARGAVHMPKPEMASRIPEYPIGTRFVVYCWGPGCNGATRAGLIISELGYAVKEMIGGFEYWAREGFDVDRVVADEHGHEVAVDATRAPDPLTAPVTLQRDDAGAGLVTPGAAALGGGTGRIACDC